MLERDIENYLVRRVKQAGGLALKFCSPGVRGVPDRLLVLPDAVVFVEVKRGSLGKISPLQRRMLNRLRSLGARAVVVRDRNEVDALLREVSSLAVQST